MRYTYMDDLQNLLGNRLGALANAISDQLQRDLIPTQPVGNSQLSVLVILHSFPGASIENISQALGLSHSNLVRVVEQLRQMSLLDKKPGRDGRSTALYITTAGETLLTDFYLQRNTQMQAVLAVLTAEEQQTLAALVNKLLTNFPDGNKNDGRICRYCTIDSCSRSDCPMHPQESVFEPINH